MNNFPENVKNGFVLILQLKKGGWSYMRRGLIRGILRYVIDAIAEQNITHRQQMKRQTVKLKQQKRKGFRCATLTPSYRINSAASWGEDFNFEKRTCKTIERLRHKTKFPRRSKGGRLPARFVPPCFVRPVQRCQRPKFRSVLNVHPNCTIKI